MSKENPHRHHKRSRLLKTLNVVDTRTGAALGTLIDLSLNGFSVALAAPIAIGGRRHVTLQLTEDLGPDESLDLECECRWLRQDAGVSGFVGGFRFTSHGATRVRTKLDKLLRKLR